MSDLSSKCFSVYDHFGLFVGIARRLAESGARVLYSTPIDRRDSIYESIIGDGFPEIKCVDDFWPLKNQIDCFVFPDIRWDGLQAELRSQGFPVWGSQKGMALEQDRLFLMNKLEELGLDVPPYDVVVGLDNLGAFLKDKKDIWIKVSKWRGCFDGQTEIMTESGWRKFEDLHKVDKVATMNPDTREMEFRIPDSHIKYWHDGEMVQIKGRKIDALVTPNHGFWSKSRSDVGWKYRIAEQLEGKQFIIPRACQWKGREIGNFTVRNEYENTTHRGRNHAGDLIFKASDWLEFLGWFISEGSLNLAGKNRTKYKVNVAQSKVANPEKYKRIHELLLRMGFNPQIEGQSGFSVYNKSLFIELAKSCYSDTSCDCRAHLHCCHKKRIPRYVFELSTYQIVQFFEAYRMGDGCSDKGKFSYYTSSKILADDIQELLSRVGKAGAISSRIRNGGKIGGRQIKSFRPQFTITELTTPDINVIPSMISRVKFSGYVYCVDVRPYHSILVRRNGKMFWSGNSWETFHWKSWDENWSDLDSWAVKFGGIKNHIRFICFPKIETDLEIGADTYCIDGQWPSKMLHGIERKNKAYFSAVTVRDKMPEQLLVVMEALSPFLKEVGYRNQWSMENRVTKDKNYFIDATCRGGLPSTPSFCAAKNLPEIIFNGARGEMVEPEFDFKFTAECAVELEDTSDNWGTAKLDEQVEACLFAQQCCGNHGQLWFPPLGTASGHIGWMRTTGNTPEEALLAMNKMSDALPDGCDAAVESLADIIREIESEHEQGIHFTSVPIPDANIVLEPS